MSELPSDNYYIPLRTKAKSGDASMGVTYGMYLILYGAIIHTGVYPGEQPSMTALRFADCLVVTNEELRHASYGELEIKLSQDALTKVSLSDFSSIFYDLGVEKMTQSDVNYARYQHLIYRLNQGHQTAGEVGRALRGWQQSSMSLRKEAEYIISQLQNTLDLEGGSMNGDEDDSPVL